MATPVASGVAAFLGGLLGSILVTPRADGSILITLKPYRFLYAKTVSVGVEPMQVLEKNARSVLIKADGSNSDDVLVGDSSVSDGAGYQLEKSEAISFNVSNPDNLFLRAKSGTQKVHIIVLGD